MWWFIGKEKIDKQTWEFQIAISIRGLRMKGNELQTDSVPIHSCTKAVQAEFQLKSKVILCVSLSFLDNLNVDPTAVDLTKKYEKVSLINKNLVSVYYVFIKLIKKFSRYFSSKRSKRRPHSPWMTSLGHEDCGNSRKLWWNKVF